MVEDTAPDDMQEVMEDVTDVSSQTDALASDEEGANEEEDSGDEAQQADVPVDDITSNLYVQVIQPEDIGDASDPDGAVAVTPNCACN